MDARKEFVEIIKGEFGACADRDAVLIVPSLEDGWDNGIMLTDRAPITMHDDLCWWFLDAFTPDELPLARKIFHCVPEFFCNLAKLDYEPSYVDWNLVHYLRRHIMKQIWPTAYQIATGATKGQAGRASELIKRLTTAEQWQKKY